jgi:hypothetical protein
MWLGRFWEEAANVMGRNPIARFSFPDWGVCAYLASRCFRT